MPPLAKILVVDDEPAILEVIQKILTDRGFHVDIAADGMAALALLERGNYDLMLSDVKMPLMDGMELLQRVGLLYPDLVTVMLSGFANIQDAVAAIKLGAYDYIAKPVYPEDLVLSIQRALKFKELRQAQQELEWTLQGAEALGLRVLDLAPETEEFQVLEKLRQEAKSKKTLADLADLFLQGAQKLTLASRGSIFLFDRDGVNLTCLACSDDQADKLRFQSVRPSEGVMSSVLQRGRPLLVVDVGLEPRYFSYQRSERYSTRSFMVVPVVGNKTWGVINLTDRCDYKPFSPRELFLTWLLARILSESLQHWEWEDTSRTIKAALEASQSELEGIKESLTRLPATMPVGVALLDRKLRLRFFNPTFAKLLRPQDPTLGKNLLPNLPPISMTDRQKIKAGFRRILQGEATVECGQITLPHPEQGNSFCQVHLIRVEKPGADLDIMMVLEDVTEVSQLQQRLSLYEHLAIMGKLSTCVVHELNNPLDGVKRYISLAQLKKDQAEDVERYLAEAQRGLSKMSMAINSILNVANPSRILKSQETLISQIREAVKIMLLQAKDQRIEITLSTPPIFEELFYGTDLYTVFVNLIKNAVQAMPGGGKIQIIGLETAGQVEIRFKDNGPGIPAAVRDDIFKPFFTTKTQGQGLGLGLTICQKIISRYQGSIAVESTVGQGTEFIITLPLAERFHLPPQDEATGGAGL